MKKSISVILCLSLVLCSLFSIGSVAFAAEASTAGNLLSVKTDGVFNDTITYTVYLKAGVNTSGALVKVVYDPNVLEVTYAGMAQGSPMFGTGLSSSGPDHIRNDMYAVIYANTGEYKNPKADTAFMQFTFKVKGTVRPNTSVAFYCNEFLSDSQPDNKIDKRDDYEAFYTWTGTTLSTTHVVSATMFEGGVTVEWEPTIGAIGYVVYKVINGSWSEIARTTECSFVDYQVANNNIYQYTVRAYNENGLNSSFEQGVSICYLLAPSLLWLSPTGSSVMASWPATHGINTYRLYRRAIYIDGDRGNWVLVGETNKTSLVDSTSTVLNWNNYEYAVCSVSGNNESPKYTISQVRTSTIPNVTLALGNDGVWYCYTNGAVNFDYRGLVSYNSDWFYVENGIVNWNYSGLVEYSGAWYYVVNGFLDWNVTTLTYYNNIWYYVENGQINWERKTLCNFGGDWYYVENGAVNWNYTGLVSYGGNWYYVVNGFLDSNVTTLTYYNNVWYYVENGQINWECKTLCSYGSDWYYVENGSINWGYTGLVSYGGNWYYVENGVVNWNYTGLVSYGGNWYHVVNGFLDWGVTTLTYYNNAWYYVENGQINWERKTLCSYGSDWYYVENGAVNWNYTGLVSYGGNWYHVVNGFLDRGVTTLTYYNNTWYYVEDGQINWNSDTLCNYQDNWYYVKNGAVDWEYTGYVNYDGVDYYIINGYLDWSKQ